MHMIYYLFSLFVDYKTFQDLRSPALPAAGEVYSVFACDVWCVKEIEH
jgi:hypothetical protein